MIDFQTRLEEFLQDKGLPTRIEQLTPDASTREYFRVDLPAGPAIACVYPEAFRAAEQSYLDATSLFLKAGLPVAQILDFDEARGIILLEDFGDRVLRDEMANVSEERREVLVGQAICLIAKIQAATDTAFALGSIASTLRFDREKLLWELEFFLTHYFETLRSRPLAAARSGDIRKEFDELAAELESAATVLCHRDFHAANLMIDGQNQLRIIDHQDARIGTASYDLVSLLLDRVTEPPPAEWLARQRRSFLEQRVKLGLSEISESAFAEEFRLQTIQRCLKAAGTFSYQAAARGKEHFLPFIQPMFGIVLRSAEKLNRFPAIQNVLRDELGA